MKIHGAVLSEAGRPQPWSDSQPLTVSELELDDPGPGELLVRMEAAGVCHSDLSRVTGAREAKLPLVLGHEGAGVIEKKGPDTDGWDIGQKVTMIFMPRCGTCSSCRSQHWALCENGMKSNAEGSMLRGGFRLKHHGKNVDHHGGVSAFAEYAVVDKASLVAVPKEVPSDVAALLGCAVLTGGGAVINAAKVTGSERVAIVGMGGVGLAAALVAKAVGAMEVIAIDTLEEKLELAREIGVDRGMLASDTAESGEKFDAVIDCVGHPSALSTAIAVTRVGGRTVTVGLPAPDAVLEISPLSLVTEARSIVGSYMGSGIPADDIRTYIQWYLKGRLPIEKLISGSVALHQLNAAMDALATGKVVRQIVTF